MPRNALFAENGFAGFSVAGEPERHTAGIVTEATNLYIVGNGSGGGVYRTRPGRRAQLTTAQTGGIVNAVTLIDSTGGQNIIYAAGNGTIYRWVKGAATVTALSGLGTFAPAWVQFAQVGSYLYMTGNTDGKLRRLKNDFSTDYSAAGLTTPVYKPYPKLANSTLYTLTAPGRDVAGTYTPPFGGIKTIKNAANSTDFASQGYKDIQPVELFNNLNQYYNSDWYVRLDDQQGSIYSNNAIGDTAAAVPPVTNSAGHGTGGARYPLHYRLDCRYQAQFADDSVICRCIVYSDATGAFGGAGAGVTELARQDKVISGPIGQSVNRTVIFSFVGIVDETAIRSVRIQFLAGPNNNAGANGPYVTDTVFAPFVSPLVTTTTNGNVSVLVTQPNLSSTGVDNSVVYIGSRRITFALGGVDWSGLAQLAIPVTRYADFMFGNVALNLRKTLTGTTGDGNAALTNPAMHGTINGQEYLFFDISNLTTGQRQGLQYLDVVFGNDIQLMNSMENTGKNLFQLGSVILAGNLSVGFAPYSWRFTETLGTGAAAIDSGASAVSSYLSPTEVQAQADVVASIPIPFVGTIPANTGATITAWRAGGTFSDGAYRKVATFPSGTNASGTNYAWNATTKTFRDNVPDSDLLSSLVLLDHEAAPLNATAICEYRGRIAVAAPLDAGGAGGGLWLSQLQTGAAAGLYFNGLSVPGDQSSPTTGFYTPIRGEGISDNIPIVRMVYYENRLAIFFPNARYGFSGTDAADFYLFRYEDDTRKGLIAFKAVTVFNGALVYLSTDGLRVFDEGQRDLASVRSDSLLSLPIEPLLNPSAYNFDTAPLSATAYAKSSLWVHSGRLYLAAPTSASGSDIGAVYVYDSRFGQWIGVWNLGKISGAVVFGASGDTNDLVVCDYDGQISSLAANAYGDTATRSGTVTAVAVALQSRGYESGEGSAGLKALWLSFSAACTLAPTLSYAMKANNDTAKTYTANYTLPTTAEGANVQRLRSTDHVRGRFLQWRLTGQSTTVPITIRDVELFSAVITGRNILQ